MQVKDVMTHTRVPIHTDSTLREATGMMRDLNLGALPVCENRRLVGILTNRNIAVRCSDIDTRTRSYSIWMRSVVVVRDSPSPLPARTSAVLVEFTAPSSVLIATSMRAAAADTLRSSPSVASRARARVVSSSRAATSSGR